MDQLIRFIGAVLIPLTVSLVFALARRYLPAKPLPDSRPASLADLEQQFRVTKWIFGSAMTVFAVLFALCFHGLLVWLNRYYSFAKSADGLRLWPQEAIWWFLPAFAAVSLCYELTLLVWAVFSNRDRVALYESWSSSRSGFNGRKVLLWMALIVVVPIGVLTGLALPMHATLRETDIIDCGYAFAGCQTYTYTDARRLTRIDGFRDRDGKLTERAGVVVDFADGRRWSSAEWGDFKRSVDPALTDWLQRRTGLSLLHAQTEADLGPVSK